MPYVLDGRRTHDFASFVDEVNRALRAARPAGSDPALFAPWNGTLDALSYLLGEAFARAPGTLTWAHADTARDALGHARMADWLETRVAFVHPTNRPDIEARLVEARHRHGPTLFETLADLMAAVPGLTLRLDDDAHP